MTDNQCTNNMNVMQGDADLHTISQLRTEIETLKNQLTSADIVNKQNLADITNLRKQIADKDSYL